MCVCVGGGGGKGLQLYSGRSFVEHTAFCTEHLKDSKSCRCERKFLSAIQGAWEYVQINILKLRNVGLAKHIKLSF